MDMKVGMLFAGGPAPGANAVIGAAATSFLKAGWEVLGLFHGYSHLQRHDEEPLQEGVHYRHFAFEDVQGLRNERGICIGTARAHPGKPVRKPEHLQDPERTERLRVVHQALVDLGCDALISIGGDGTLKTANLLARVQDGLPEGTPRVRVIHLPKTIDNDYHGIDFTFGYFTAVDRLARGLIDLRADAKATSCYFIAETMGRKAGWLAYGAGIAGEASLVLGVEDLPALTGGSDRISPEALAERIVDLVLSRSKRGKHYGTVVLAEGIGEHLPEEIVEQARDPRGFVNLGQIQLGRRIASLCADIHEARTGTKKKFRGVQLGYEARSTAPHAYDVLLGSQLGIGAYRALAEEHLDAHMVSITGQFDLTYIPFDDLIDPATMKTKSRLVTPGSDFQKMARFLESRTTADVEWDRGPRRED